ncbi:MAG: ATP-binding cassette domain-containing protein [Lachnospiraceae bacterium]|nr:ATP-binding cassette domain-containing protein [Lachnospiraceae bacterium]
MRLEAENVSFRYHKKQAWVLKDLDFGVEQGECVGLLAPSGYGKTTLAMLLAGYLAPSEGEILLDGIPLSPKGVCPVQLICQHPEHAVNPRWRLRKVLEESGEIQEDMLASFGIENEWLNRFPMELSGGELQRFCVARALMSNPAFLICDEISTMLDVITQAQIWNKICDEAQKRNMGVVVITHNLPLTERICKKIIRLDIIHNDNSFPF